MLDGRYARIAVRANDLQLIGHVIPILDRHSALGGTVRPMLETIRQRIKRRMRWTMAAAVAGWLLVASSTAFQPHSLPESVPAIMGALLFVGAILCIMFVRCPKCSARIGQTIAMPVAFTFGRRERVNYCPYCGVHLDQPCEQPGNPISPQ